MSEVFPTWTRFTEWLGRPVRSRAPWKSTPWWPADTLASRQTALLQVLSVAVTERLELAPLVACLAQEHRGRFRRRLTRLARRLAAGTPLADALEQTPGVLSDEQVLAIRFAVESGTLQESLCFLTESQQEPLRQVRGRLRQLGYYVGTVCVVFLLVMTFFTIKIMPSYQAIMDDFSVEETESMRLAIRVSVVISQYGAVLLFALLLGWWCVKAERPQRFLRRRVWSRLLHAVTQLRAASLLRLLAIAQRGGRPLPAVLSTLARYHYDTTVRHKLLFARNEVEQGAELWSSLAKTGLLSPAESRALVSSVEADSTEWTLRQLAAWKYQGVAQRFERFALLLTPAVILAMALVVLLAALAGLTPLYKIINELS